MKKGEFTRLLAHARSLRMTRLGAFFLGCIIGIPVAVLAFAFRDHLLPERTYTVHSIDHHYPFDTKNSRTGLVVYRRGDSGHVMQVNCAFPPDFRFTDDADVEFIWNWASKVLTEGHDTDQVDQVLRDERNTTVAELRRRVAGWRVRVTGTVSQGFHVGTYYLCFRAP